MNVLVVGSGGREHALAWKLHESPQIDALYCAPGNAGAAQEAECLDLDVSKPGEILALAKQLRADLTVIGPEAPLVAGVVDEFEKAGLAAIGPTRAASRLEGSKIFAKQFMARHQIPTARFAVADNLDDAAKVIAGFEMPVVVKADGLAAGKGVAIARTREEALRVLDQFMRQKTLGAAGEGVVIEECLTGEEVSFIVLTDGHGVLVLPPTQDHKRVFDNDEGPNTGGMGAYSDDSLVDSDMRQRILNRIVAPTLAGMAAEGCRCRGFLYCGLMLTEEGPMVLEYNVRLGDPETQPLMMRLRSDLLELFIALRDGSLGAMEAHWSPNPAVCVVLASKGYPGRHESGKSIAGFEAAETLGGVKLFHSGTRFVDHQLVTSGGRVLGVTAIAENLPAAIQRCYGAVSKIRFEGMHYRHDIGARGLRRLPPPSQNTRSPSKPTRSAQPKLGKVG